MNVEKAEIGDVKRMHEMVNSFAGKGEMLSRALSEIYENLRDHFVIRDTGTRLLPALPSISAGQIWLRLSLWQQMRISRIKRVRLGAC